MNRAVVKVAVGVAVALGSAATGVAASDDKRAGIWFSERNHDFGEVAQGEKVTFDFPFENRGRALLTLSQPIVGCDCTAEIVGPVDVPSGGRGLVRFSCDTSSSHGEQTRTATVQVSDVARRSILLTMSGRIALEAVAEPTSVYLGRVLRGSRHPRALAVRFGDRGDRIRSVATDGTFVAASVGKARGDVIVEVLSRAPLGPFTQDLRVATSNRRFPELLVPVSGVVVETQAPTRW